MTLTPKEAERIRYFIARMATRIARLPRDWPETIDLGTSLNALEAHLAPYISGGAPPTLTNKEKAQNST